MVHGLPVFDLWSVGLEIHKLNSQHRLTDLEILGIKYRLGKKKRRPNSAFYLCINSTNLMNMLGAGDTSKNKINKVPATLRLHSGWEAAHKQ